MAATQLPANTQMGQTAVADPAGTTMDTTNGNTCTNSGATFFRFANQTASPVAAQVVTAVTVEGYAVADQTINIPASVAVWAGRFDIKNFGARITLLSVAAANIKITAFEP
jgi:hypothetical protein